MSNLGSRVIWLGLVIIRRSTITKIGFAHYTSKIEDQGMSKLIVI